MKKDKDFSVPSEFVEQCQLVAWLKRTYPNVLFTASAGGMRTKIGVAKKMKRMGYSKGCPDIMIFERTNYKPNGTAFPVNWNGLFIELKRIKGGQVSPAQKQWLNNLNKRFYKAVVCNGCEEAKSIINNYIEGVGNA